MDKTDIIIAACNAEATLGACLNSLVGQRNGAWEAIVVDDGSTDRTGEIVREWAAKDNRIRCISTENRGVSAARNVGIGAARNRYVAFLDADDEWTPDALEILEKDQRETGADIVAAGYVRVKTGTAWRQKHARKTETMTAEAAIEAVLLGKKRMDSAVWGKRYERALWADVAFAEGRRYEDLEVFHKIYEKARKIVREERELYVYRDREDSFMNTFGAGRTDILDVTEDIERYMKAHHPHLVGAARERCLRAAVEIIRAMPRGYENRADIERRCQALIRERRWNSLTGKGIGIRSRIVAGLAYTGGLMPVLRWFGK